MTEQLPTAEPAYDVTGPLDTDAYAVFADLSEEDLALQKAARAFLTPEVQKTLQDAWDKGEYPTQLIAGLAEADLLRDGVEIDGRATPSRLASGLASMELSRVDGSLATIVGVQGGLAMRSIQMCGSAEQKQKYLPAMAAGQLFGAFALTEPTHGSDSVSLQTTATPVDGGWRIDGHKKWIGNGAAGGITVTWARSTEDGQVKGFIVQQDAEGYSAEVIRGKMALRAIHQALITYDGVFVPEADVLPEATSFKSTAAVLFATRLGVAWSAVGHAVGCYEAAVQYANQRVQFGRPLAESQIVQERLARMLSELTQIQLLVLRAAQLEDAGRLTGPQASLAKYSATRTARSIAANARDLLGGNGILIQNEVGKHFADLEAIHTYEGTETVQALIVGRDITGKGAFA